MEIKSVKLYNLKQFNGDYNQINILYYLVEHRKNTLFALHLNYFTICICPLQFFYSKPCCEYVQIVENFREQEIKQ